MAAFVKCAIPNRYIGAAADTKPTGVGIGSMCYEYDTGKEYVTYDGTNWVQYAADVFFGDILPLADDANYLGSSTAGWKGLHLPDTLIVDDTDVVKLRTSANDADVSLTALNLTLSGTTTALTFSGAATIVAGSGLTMPAFTLGGAVSGGGQSFTNVGDMTFASGSVLASGSTNGNTLLLRANDTTFLTFTTGATDTLTLNGDMSVASGKGINFDAYGIKITDTYIQFGDDATAWGPKLMYGSATQAKVRNAANNADADFAVGILNTSVGISLDVDAAYIRALNSNGKYGRFLTRDSDVGIVEIARFAGAADPYFQVGRDDTGVATNAVTDMLYIQGGAGNNNESAGFGVGIPFLLGNAASQVEERASIDCVLVTATDGSEAARFDFNCMTGGAAPTTKFSCGAGGIGFFGTTPAAQQAHIADASGDDAATVNAIIDALKAYGLLAPDP